MRRFLIFAQIAVFLLAATALPSFADEDDLAEDAPDTIIITDSAEADTTEPQTTETEAPQITTAAPIVTSAETTTKAPTEATTKAPTTTSPTPEPVQTEAPVIEPPQTEAPDDNVDEPQGNSGNTYKPSKTSGTTKSTTTRPSKTTAPVSGTTASVESDSVTTVEVFEKNGGFVSPLHVVSFLLGVPVIISLFLAIFAIARRIVKKYTDTKKTDNDNSAKGDSHE